MNNKILVVSANYYKDISKNLELGASNTLKENGYCLLYTSDAADE